jgi:hypothetical protein
MGCRFVQQGSVLGIELAPAASSHGSNALPRGGPRPRLTTQSPGCRPARCSSCQSCTCRWSGARTAGGEGVYWRGDWGVFGGLVHAQLGGFGRGVGGAEGCSVVQCTHSWGGLGGVVRERTGAPNPPKTPSTSPKTAPKSRPHLAAPQPRKALAAQPRHEPSKKARRQTKPPKPPKRPQNSPPTLPRPRPEKRWPPSPAPQTT